MADRESSFTISFDGSEGNLDAIVSSLKSKIRSAVAEIQSTSSKVELFATLETDVQKAATAFTAASAKVAELKAQIDSVRGSGGTIGADLAKQFKLAETAAASASKEYNNQVTRLTALQTKLSAAGVNTGNLAAEQLRLAAALKTATAAAGQQSAKDLLGFKSLDDVQPKITALTAAFNTLRASGKLSSTEIGAAQTLLGEKIAATRAQVSGLSSGFGTQTASIKAFISDASTKLIGFAATAGIAFAALKSITDESREFRQGMSQIGAITTLTDDQLAALGEQARTLARTLGFDVVEGVKALQQILSAGIPADNAIEILAVSSETAKIAQTDLGTAVKLSTTLVQGFGIQTDDVNRVLAIFFQASKNGGPTIAALAEDLGKLGPIAKATNTPIEEIAAALQVMVKAGVPAGDAIGDLNKVLIKFNSEAARKQLAALGITTTDFVQALVQLGAKGGPTIDQLLDIGLASTKSVAGVAALTNNSKALTDALAAQSGATELATKALEAFERSPKERLELLKAAVNDLSITLGDSVGTSSKFAVVIANLLNLFNRLSPATRDQVAQMGFLTVVFGGFGPLIASVSNAYDRLTSSQSASAAAAIQVAAAATQSTVALQKAIAGIQAVVSGQADAVKKQLEDARAGLQGFVADLQIQITAYQAATAAAITDLNARAAAQIAALDRSTAAEKATAEATLAIQSKLTDDRIALIVKNNAEILKAIDAAGAAQLALVKDFAEKTKAVDLTVNQAKLAALAIYKGQLAAALADAVAQEQGYVAKINAIDASRVSFNQGVQQQLTDIRNEGLSGFDQYIAKTTQISNLLAQAQQAFAQGGAAGLALGKSYVDQIIAISGQLKTVVNADGVAVISAFDVQQKKIEVITKAANLYNDALDGQEAAANAGKNASVAAIDAVTPKLADITQQYDELSKKVAEGLAIKIKLDEDGIANAEKAIDEALAAKEHLLAVKVDVDAVQAQVETLVANLKKGVVEGADAQLAGITASLNKIVAEAPQLQLKVDDALKQVDSIKTEIDKISTLKPKLTVDSNVADVQKDIDHLKLPTESTHTIHIVTDGGAPGGTEVPLTGFRKGGPVGAIRRATAPAREAWQRFAGGGFAFPRLIGAKVPGIGNQDTVPAALPSGAFVLRKAAAQHYGDTLMKSVASGRAAFRVLTEGGPSLPNESDELSMVRPRDRSKARIAIAAQSIRYLAGGGFGMNDRGTGTSISSPAATSPYIGISDRPTLEGGIDAPSLPSDPKKKRALILNYVLDVASAAVVDDFFFWKSMLRALNDAKASYDFAPTDAHLDKMLDRARDIGLNLGYSKRTKIGFDVDGRKWHKQLTRQDIPAGLLGALVYDYEFYAHGGQAGTDTVDALLTPGEYVINAPRAGELGASFLHALNDMRVPRETLTAALNPEPPRRPPARFAEGGMVGEISGGQNWQKGAQWSGGGAPITVNMNVSVADILSLENIRRHLMPALREIERRGK